MTNQNKTAIEALAFIKSIMEDSQKSVANNGLAFIVWGFLILGAGLFRHFLDQPGLVNYISWMYLGVVSVGWIFMYFFTKAHHNILGNPITNKLLGSIWIAVLISMTILGLVGGISRTIDLNHMTAVMYTVLGTAYFLQGVITGKIWVRNLGFGWWGGSIVLFFIAGLPAIILSSVMMVGLQVVPGFIFNKQWKSHFTEQRHD